MQTFDELEAHFGPDGPVAAAREWVSLILAGELRAAWAKTDPELRLQQVEAWLDVVEEWPEAFPEASARLSGEDHHAVALSLASRSSECDLWPAFEEAQTEVCRNAWADFGDWSNLSRPRPVPPDSELVVFVRGFEGGAILLDETVIPVALVLRLRATGAGWRVAEILEAVE